MNNILSFISQYEKIFSILFSIIMFVISFLLYRKTGDIKYLKEVLSQMKYKTENSVTGLSPQTFDKLKPVYRLNKSTGKLEKTDEVIDIDELVRSSLSLTLDFLVDKFLPSTMGVSDEIFEVEDVTSKLDVMQNAFIYANELRKKYNLGEDLTVDEVFSKVKEISTNLSTDLKTKLDAISKVKDVVKNDVVKVPTKDVTTGGDDDGSKN